MSHRYFDVPSWETDFSVHQTWIVEPFKNLRIHFCSFTRHFVKAFSWSMLKHLRIQLSTTAKIHKNTRSRISTVKSVKSPCSASVSGNLPMSRSPRAFPPVTTSRCRPYPCWRTTSPSRPCCLSHGEDESSFFKPPFKRKITQEVDQQTWRINNVLVFEH